jgi:hypothetical protein
MTNIAYTFAKDCAIPQLRGRTFTGGEFCRIDGKWQGEPDAVRFAERVDGHVVMARIAGNPELEAALSAHQAAKQAVADRLDAIGWAQYQAVQSRAYNAREAYDRASERGYPVREAAAMRAADEALDVACAQYPLAAAYAQAESYSQASNYAKAGAGRDAMLAIESGADPIETIAAMQASWSDAAWRAVQNA